jgi:hypothetical protein
MNEFLPSAADQKNSTPGRCHIAPEFLIEKRR